MGILDRFSIRAKLTILLGITAVALTAVLATAAAIMHQRMIDDRIGMLHSVVDTAYGIAASLDAEVQKGTLSRAEAMERLGTTLRAMKFAQGDGYLVVIRSDGTILIHGVDRTREGQNHIDDKDAYGKAPTGLQVELIRRQDEGVVSYYFPKPGAKIPVQKLQYVKAFRPWDVLIGTGVYIDDVEADYKGSLYALVAMVLVVLVFSAGVTFLVSRTITAALGRLKGRMERLAAGELEIDVPEAARADELGAMGKAVQVFKTNALSMRRMEAERAEAKARAEAEKKQAQVDLADSFETRVAGIVGAVSKAAAEMQTTARSMVGTAETSRSLSVKCAEGSDQVTNNVQTVAAAAEELSASINEIGRQVTQSSSISITAAEEAQRTNAIVSGLADTVASIGDVVRLINDIASQTNLLALNATIEAARAGDAGKGFAVVASEVKTLANQTAKATEEISGQIAAVQGATRSSVEAIQQVARTIRNVSEISSAIAAAVEEQTAATHDISHNVNQAAQATGQVTATIGGVATAVDKEGRAAAEVLAAADGLARQAEDLRHEVDRFLLSIRQGH